ncbi:MAG: 16S rRNA (guanine(966)-N(2))-methyltransferase RsmD [Rhodospirillales bacterium]|nr:16S rRNA (guanine(966)-N(2))-methyltransferase RsmD [Rhodospirillales bacterium]
MRIVAGAWRGRALTAPAGATTRPTADRVRQALFDMLLHAPWGGRAAIEGVVVLDLFAGTGAFGLEALSRGAARATFVEQDRAAILALRHNVAACRAEDRCRIVAGDVLALAPGEPAGLVFLDPPYGQDLVPRAVTHLARTGRIAAGALVVAETGRDEAPSLAEATAELLAERAHGAARLWIWRIAAPAPA